MSVDVLLNCPTGGQFVWISIFFTMSADRVLLGVGLVYFVAFCSLYIQLPGLIGDDGIAPVRLLPLSVPKSWQDFMLGTPTLLRFKDLVSLDAYHFTEALVLIGILISFLVVVSRSLRLVAFYLALWLCFLSVVKVIAPLERFWWSSTLLEAGLMATILSFQLGKRRYFPSYHIVAFSVRWLLFRITVSAGLAKLSQRDSEWWSLGALKSHMDSQLLPTPVAWYTTALPDWILRLVCAVVLMMHLITPVLFLVPLPGVQLFCFYSEVLLYAPMLVCGNYGFDSLLMLSLCYVFRPNGSNSKKGSTILRLMSTAASLSLISVVLYASAVFFGVRPSGNKINVDITVPYEHFRLLVGDLIRYSVPAACVIFGLTLLYSIYTALRARGCMRKMEHLTVVLLTGLAATGLFLGSSVSWSYVLSTCKHNLPDIAEYFYFDLVCYA
uniref:Lipase maturation factor n=1 Tax=Schistocephalus solidus TaxID=70667 RepID=A0A0X3PLS4_SCHSO